LTPHLGLGDAGTALAAKLSQGAGAIG